jgi:hypothetical protein
MDQICPHRLEHWFHRPVCTQKMSTVARQHSQSPANIRSVACQHSFSRLPTFVQSPANIRQSPANIRGERSAPALQLHTLAHPPPPCLGARVVWRGTNPGTNPWPNPSPPPPPRGRGVTARQCRPGFHTSPPPSRLPHRGSRPVEPAWWQYAAVHLASFSHPLARCPHLG